MGCFNVSCMLSKLTIHEGDKCYLFPLIPMNKETLIGATSQFLYNNDLFNLFCLPIEGIYNDYGSIEDIVKTKNTEMIENYLGISIENFVACLTDCRKDYFDSYSTFYDVFCKFANLSDDLSLEEYLKEIGFKEDGSEFYISGTDYFIKKSNDESFNIYSKKLQNLGELTDWNKEDILKIHYQRTNEYLGMEHEETFHLLSNMSCGFVSGDVLDNLPKKQSLWTWTLDSAYFLKKDFKLTDNLIFEKHNHKIKLCSDSIIEIDNEKFNFPNKSDFEKYWKEITGEDLSNIYSKKEDLTYENYLYKCKSLLSVKNGNSEVEKHLYDMKKLIFSNSFGMEREIPYFLNIYQNGLLDIKNEWLLTEKFLNYSYNSNVLIFPTFQGPQGGDIDSELQLSLTILKSCLKEYFKYEEEMEETSDSKKFKKLFEYLKNF